MVMIDGAVFRADKAGIRRWRQKGLLVQALSGMSIFSSIKARMTAAIGCPWRAASVWINSCSGRLR